MMQFIRAKLSIHENRGNVNPTKKAEPTLTLPLLFDN